MGENVLDQLIDEWKRLLEQVLKHYEDAGIDDLPAEKRITVAELEAWYRGVGEALDRAFGPESDEASRWRDRQASVRQESREKLGEAPPGGSWVVYFLTESLGTLAQIRVLRLAGSETRRTRIGFDSFHPMIAERCRRRFANEEYDDAVFAAFKAVEETIRQRSGARPTDVGVQLVSDAMNTKSGRLRFTDVAAEQEAIHSLFRGAIGAFKSPLSHRSLYLSDPVRTMELLAFASSLLRLIDELPENR